MFKKIAGLISLFLGVALLGMIIYFLLGGQIGPPGKAPFGGKSILSAGAMVIAFFYVSYKWLIGDALAKANFPNIKNAPVKLTLKAAQQINQLMQKPGQVLRVDVTGDPVGGFNYEMNLDTPARNGDIRYTQNGVKIVVAQNILPYLKGTTIDWESTQTAAGFRFNNPNSAN